MMDIMQLIYIQEGKEAIFKQFEAVVIPLIKKYKGKLLLRIRPESESVIEGELETPYEMHLISFESEQDFDAFMGDEERNKFIYLKEQSIKSVLMIKGRRSAT